ATLFLLQRSRDHRHLHSFPTRRSSDLATSASGMGWPSKSHMTVRSLGSAWKQRPWSTDHSRPSSPSRQCPPFLSALLASTSKTRSEEHTSELQSRFDLVCRLLLEKKKK